MGLMERPNAPTRPLKPAQLAILMSQPVCPCTVLPGPVQNLLHLVGLTNARQMGLAAFSRLLEDVSGIVSALQDSRVPLNRYPQPPVCVGQEGPSSSSPSPSPCDSSCLSHYLSLCTQAEQAFSSTDFQRALRLYSQAWEVGARHFPLGHRGLGSVAGNAGLAAQWGHEGELAYKWYVRASNEARASASAYAVDRRDTEGSWRESGRLGEVMGWLSCVGVLLLRHEGRHEAALGVYEALLPFVLLPPLPASSVTLDIAAAYQLNEQTPCDALLMADLLGNAANAYLHRHDPSSALSLLTPSLALRPCPSPSLASTLTALGNAHALLHDRPTAHHFYTQALSVYRSLGIPPSHPSVLHLHSALLLPVLPPTGGPTHTEMGPIDTSVGPREVGAAAREEAGSALLDLASPPMTMTMTMTMTTGVPLPLPLPLQMEGQAGGAIARALSGHRSGHRQHHQEAHTQPLLSSH